MTNIMGTVVGKNHEETGYMVEVYTGGTYATYGPMQFITTPPFEVPPNLDPYNPGDKVFITNFNVRDQFVILGKYMDMTPQQYDLIQVDTDGDGIIDVIEESYEEEPGP